MEHYRITVEGRIYEVTVEKSDGDESGVPTTPAASPAAPLTNPPPRAAADEDTSPLAGIVQAIHVTVGSTVKTGDTVITLEAMKMLTAINASSNGVIRAIHVKIGDAVDEGQSLYLIG